MGVTYHFDTFPPRPEAINLHQFGTLLGEAHSELTRFDTILSTIPNPSILLTPLSQKEAEQSSRIEGTQATVKEALEYEAEGKGEDEAVGDVRELLNYRKAMNEAVEALKELPISGRLLKRAHRTLLSGVRGEHKDPGHYRRIENWIGSPGCGKEEARFIPPPPEQVEDRMSEWERYVNSETNSDRLIHLGVAHAEFEAIHPFLDGNGRLGRIIIPIYLYNFKVISNPVFYISAFFETRRDEYYERLLAVSRDNDWNGWCKFFLSAVKAQAKENHEKASAIIKLYDKLSEIMLEKYRSPYIRHAMDAIFKRPYFNSAQFIEESGIPNRMTASRILEKLVEASILEEVKKQSGRRPSNYLFPELMGVVE